MHKNIITITTIAIVSVFPGITLAIEQTPAPSTSIAPLVAEAISTVPPATTGSVSTIPPATTGSVSTVPPATTGSISTVPPATTGSVSTVPSSSGSNGGSTGGSSSSGSSQSNGGSYYTGSSGSRIFFPGCPIVTTFVKIGEINDVTQVTKIQNFLKNYEKSDVVANGIYDAKTIAAVRAFQVKYSNIIMAPWGITEPTGNVYITTAKKMNEIACYQPLTLNATELATINSYKYGVAVKPTIRVSTTTITSAPQDTSASVSAEDVVLGSDSANQNTVSESNTDQTASVGKVSILGRFWNFLAYLFK